MMTPVGRGARVSIGSMRRGFVALALAVAALVSAAPVAAADGIDDDVSDLAGGGGDKVRVAAALSLAKVTDDRATLALAAALGDDTNANVRRVCAIALKQTVTAKTGKRAREAAIDALRAATKDSNKKVKKAATKSLAVVTALFQVNAPKVFINVDPPKDHSKKAPAKSLSELDKILRHEVTHASKDYATEWPGDLPTGHELDQQGTAAFIVAASVSKVTVSKAGSRTTVDCTVEIRVAPWGGTDGTERWSAGEVGKATGSGQAQTSSDQKSIDGGVVDCVSAVGEQLTDEQILPFIRHLVK